MAVYFIQNTQTRSIKIGSSVDPHDRIRSFQTHNEFRLEILHIVHEWGQNEELGLHRRFAAYRTGDGGREWFRNDPELMRFITELQGPSARAETLKGAMWLVGVGLAAGLVVLLGLAIWAALQWAWFNRIYFVLGTLALGAAAAIAWAVRSDRRRALEVQAQLERRSVLAQFGVEERPAVVEPTERTSNSPGAGL